MTILAAGQSWPLPRLTDIQAAHPLNFVGAIGAPQRLAGSISLKGAGPMPTTITKSDSKPESKTVTKKDLIDQIANETKQKRTAVKRTIQAFLQKMITELQAGHRLEFRDFGVFEIRIRAPRVAQNPKTLERVPVPARKTVKFKVGRLMRDALDGKASAAEMMAVLDHSMNGHDDDE